MRILVLQDDFPPHHVGGSGAVAYALAHAMHSAGHDVRVITAVQEPALAGYNKEGGIEVTRIYTAYHERWVSSLSLYNPQTIPAIKKIVREWRPDVVHAHNVHRYLSYHSLKLAAQSGAKVFLTAHDSMLYAYGKARDDKKLSALASLKKYRLRYNPFRNTIIRGYLAYVKKIVAVSNALKEALKNNKIDCKEVIYNGIDVSQWVAAPEAVAAFKQKYRLGNEVILFGGRLSGQKGGEKMLDAFAIVLQNVPTAQLLVLGAQNAYMKELLANARYKNIAGKIISTGWISGPELRAAYHAAALVAVPSLYLDPFPTVNLEAMACKKPVVATCFGGSRELVVDNQTGYVVNPFDVATMAGKLAELLRNKQKNVAFGEAGYKRIVEQFSLGKQIAEYEKLFAKK